MASKVCAGCGHLINGALPHACPGPDYAGLRDSIIRDAAAAAEAFTHDELEAFAREAFGAGPGPAAEGD